MMDVARAAGVSKSTVSRALAGDARVNAATRLRIEEVACRLGYTPNRIARALARGRTGMLAVATPGIPRSFSDPFYLEFLGGLGDRAVPAGYNLILASSESPEPPPLEAPPGTTRPPTGSEPLGGLRELVAGGAVDGVVLTENTFGDPRIPLLEASGIPFVVLGTPSGPPAGNGDAKEEAASAAYVDGDNPGGARLGVQHLIELGHREIACITGPLHLVSASRRLAGYLEAMEGTGAAIPPHRVVRSDFTREGGLNATRELLRREQEVYGGEVRFTAIFASDDVMAIGALEALREEGLRVPDDVSVLGFDGISLARLLEPPLTTVAQPIYRLGQLAAELLLECVDASRSRDVTRPKRGIVVPVSLQVGGSTGPPPPSSLGR